MYIGGIASTAHLDKEDERIIQKGLDFGPFLADGWFNDNHGQRTVDVVGYPTEAFYVTQGTRLPNDKIAESAGWWVEGYLLNTDEGRKIFALARSLAQTNSPRRLGFSIEGKVAERSATDSSTVTKAIVRNVAITHCPVNTKTEMGVLSKALTAGSVIDAAQLSNPAPGDGGALRVESLSGGALVEEEEEIGDLTKAEAEAATEEEIFAEWAPALQRAARRMTPPARLSKAEAEIIVRDHYPHLSDREIDRIIAGGTR